MLVLRVWLEPVSHDASGLRARITAENELGSGERATFTAADVDGVVEIVRSWVERFAAGP